MNEHHSRPINENKTDWGFPVDTHRTIQANLKDIIGMKIILGEYMESKMYYIKDREENIYSFMDGSYPAVKNISEKKFDKLRKL